MDQATEETANRDTKTPGGAKGFGTHPSAIARYYLTADYKRACICELRNMIDDNKSSFDHPDLRISRIRKDERDVKLLLEMLENHYRDPFGFDAGDLCSLSTGAVQTPLAALDMLNV